jgi:hypothetical protein
MGYARFSLKDFSSCFLPEIRIARSGLPILACESAELATEQVYSYFCLSAIDCYCRSHLFDRLTQTEPAPAASRRRLTNLPLPPD